MSFRVQAVCKIYICLAIQQIAQHQPRTLQVDSIDLEITPVQRSVGVVVIDLTLALRIFGPLNGKRHAAGRSKLSACILLVRGQRMALVQLGRIGVRSIGPPGDYEWPLKPDSNGRLQVNRIGGVKSESGIDDQSSQRQRGHAKRESPPSILFRLRPVASARRFRWSPPCCS